MVRDLVSLNALCATPVRVGRRRFLQQSGLLAVATLGGTLLTACQSGAPRDRMGSSSDGFFADGTDFAD